LQRNDAGVWLCEYPGLSFQRSPVCACSLVSSLLLSGATMSQQSSLTQSAHSVRQVLTAYTAQPASLPLRPTPHQRQFLGGGPRERGLHRGVAWSPWVQGEVAGFHMALGHCAQQSAFGNAGPFGRATR